MKTTIEFYPESSRYVFDTGICSSKKGFAQIDTSQDAWYFGTWANPKTWTIVTYAEGDVITTVCDDKEEFINEINNCRQWNIEDGNEFAIDPGLSAENIKAWEDMGLSNLLH